MGINCTILKDSCRIMKPCLNSGTCKNNFDDQFGYTCTCPPDFEGRHCEIDKRICRSDTCQNDGE